MMKWRTIIKLFVVPALALVVTFYLVSWLNKVTQKDVIINQSNPNIRKTVSSGEADIGGTFTLMGHTGNKVEDVDFKDKYRLVYFGFTSCPEICPTDMQLISIVMQKLKKESPKIADKIQPIFITIDPERDTPAKINSFLQSFDSSFVGLTGSREQIADIINKYKVYAKKVAAEDVGTYSMDHSAYFYFMDKNGKYITHFNDKQTDAEIADKLSGLVK